MENMGDLCTACMCSGRNLYYIGETGFYDLYSQILNEIQVYDTSPFYIRVCWECVAHLRRWLQFKETAKRSYTQLQYVQQNNFEQEPEPSHLVISHAYNYSYPEQYIDLKIKTEADETQHRYIETDLRECESERDRLQDVKTEDTHCEPETFVNNLNLEPTKKRGRKVEKQPLKDKPKKKAKPKREETPVKKKVKVKKKRSPSPSLDSLKDEHLDGNELETEDDVEVKDNVIDGMEMKVEVPLVEEKPLKEKPKKKAKPKREKIPVKKKIKVEKKRSSSPSLDSLKDEHLYGNELETEDDVEVKDNVIDGMEEKVEVPLVEESTRLNGVEKESKEVPAKEAPLPERPHCEECGKNFSSRKTYRYHLNVLHKGQNRYPCPRCGKVYQWKSNLGRHLRSHKARDSGELYCETCDKRFASVATYRQHLRVSRQHVPESEFSFMCNECGKKFVNKTRLRDHIDWEHLKKIKFRCQLCNKPFKCHTSLYVHLQNVHRNKEKKDNLCHVCGKSYQNAAKLKYHIVAMHTSETPYQCQHCTAAFGWYSSLYRHVREVHYKLRLQPRKPKKGKKDDIHPALVPL